MSDNAAELEQRTLAEIAGAADEAALETVRVAALGKNGSIASMPRSPGGAPL